MDIRHSNGEINSVREYFLKRKFKILNQIFILILGYVLLRTTLFVVPHVYQIKGSKSIIENNINNIKTGLDIVYLIAGNIILVLLVWSDLKANLYNSYIITENGIAFLSKKKVKDKYSITDVVGYKVDKKANLYRVLIFIKHNISPLPKTLVLGEFDEQSYVKIDSYFLKIFKKYDINDFHFTKPLN